MAGKSLPFTIEQDGYVRIVLEDGARLRLRPVIVDVRESGIVAGEQVYEVASFVHVVVEKSAGDVLPTSGGDGGQK